MLQNMQDKSLYFFVLLKGVDPGFHSVPLHHIKLKSNFVSGQVVVGVGHTLPVEDISLLFDIGFTR
jgi:hypothetical protein